MEKILYWIVRICAYVLPFTVLLVSNSLLFPFITGKNLLFRTLIEIMVAGWIGLLILDFSASAKGIDASAGAEGGSAFGGKKYWPRWNALSIALTVFVGTIFLYC